MALSDLLLELEAHGTRNDASETDRAKKLLNITRDTGEFLAVMVKSVRAQRVLEIGTSNGYSTLWLANALPATGRVVTIEKLSEKAEMAAANFARAGLADRITQIQGDAGEYLNQTEESFDLIFLDADRSVYLSYIEPILSRLSSGGVLICDNAISHHAELVDFMSVLNQQEGLTTCLIPVGKGEFVVHQA
ncbi:O-methyltransferase [Photobacterium sp. GJ3]|uniref:O-methyltransferase n=1 Tax=Photobacterium sp. GJ3 TaxID=2829502 RepID=UPI001B8AF328|nr:O-methyltransferase [Photobacterium sp. GJ3]QUJ68992.1 O-methyltransferase [Photobacterium sp. GJ3]